MRRTTPLCGNWSSGGKFNEGVGGWDVKAMTLTTCARVSQLLLAVGWLATPSTGAVAPMRKPRVAAPLTGDSRSARGAFSAVAPGAAPIAAAGRVQATARDRRQRRSHLRSERVHLRARRPRWGGAVSRSARHQSEVPPVSACRRRASRRAIPGGRGAELPRPAPWRSERASQRAARIRSDRQRDPVTEHDLFTLPPRSPRDLQLSEPMLRGCSGDAV